MERRGRTDIWPEVNDVSNLTLLDKILRDGRRGLTDHALTHGRWATKCNLKLQESTVGHPAAAGWPFVTRHDNCYRQCLLRKIYIVYISCVLVAPTLSLFDVIAGYSVYTFVARRLNLSSFAPRRMRKLYRTENVSLETNFRFFSIVIVLKPSICRSVLYIDG